MCPVPAIVVGMIAAQELGIALAQRLAIGVPFEAKRIQITAILAR